MEADEQNVEDVASSDELVYHHHVDDDDDDDDEDERETAKLLSNNGDKQRQCNDIPIVKSPEPVVLYKRRWLMLLIFSVNTAMNGCLFMSISPINDIVRTYYGVKPIGIEWLSNMCVVTYVFLSLPITYLMTKHGVRPIMCAVACCNFIATVFHFTGYPKNRFYLVVLGQVFAAVSYSAVIQTPGLLSATWFPDHERATATSIGVVMNLFGVAIGFMQPSLMVQSHKGAIESEIKSFYLSQMILAAIILLFTILYKERPPSPPSTSKREHIGFSDSLKLLIRNKNFLFLSQSYAIYFALFVNIFVLLNPLITWKFKDGFEPRIGWMGFWNNIVAMAAFVMIGRLLDLYHKFQLTAILLNLCSMVLWVCFVLVLTLTDSFDALYIIYLVMGVCFVPYFAVGIEQAAEMTYPVSEVTSSSIMLSLGNVYSFIFIIVFGIFLQYKYVQVVGYSIAVLYLVSTALASLAKTDLNRLVSEKSDA